jgi:hypothetical protein
MQALAPLGSIAVTETTSRLCEGYFILKSLGLTQVKGLGEPLNVYEVIGFGPLRTRLQRSAGRGLTGFVGRKLEMEAMRNAAELARAGNGQIVAAMAEAGTGKSRLLFEFKAISQSGWMVLETFSCRTARRRRICRCSICCMDISKSRVRTTHARDARKLPEESRFLAMHQGMRCHICSICSVSSRATIHWRRWTGS